MSRTTQDTADAVAGFAYRVITVFDRPFQTVRLPAPLSYAVLLPRVCRNIPGLGSSAFARHYLRNHCYFLLLWVMRCFSSPRLLPAWRDDTGYGTGLPHSDICGSRDICSSPQLFAAYHVLLRLREPRHPPYALAYFLRRRYRLRYRVVWYIMSLLLFLYSLLLFQHVNDLSEFVLSDRGE